MEEKPTALFFNKEDYDLLTQTSKTLLKECGFRAISVPEIARMKFLFPQNQDKMKSAILLKMANKMRKSGILNGVKAELLNEIFDHLIIKDDL